MIISSSFGLGCNVCKFVISYNRHNNVSYQFIVLYLLANEKMSPMDPPNSGPREREIM